VASRYYGASAHHNLPPERAKNDHDYGLTAQRSEVSPRAVSTEHRESSLGAMSKPTASLARTFFLPRSFRI
jgi:hypothetical protein